MRRQRRSKIVATLGPASSEPTQIARLFEAGADVFRINMSHTPPDRMRALVRAIRKIEDEHGRPIAILVDLQGPKLRIGAFASDAVTLVRDAQFTLDADPAPGDANRVHLPHPEILAALEPGHTLLLDDGKIRLTTIETTRERAVTRVVVGGKLTARKGVSLPDTTIAASALTPKDRTDLEAALDAGIDWVGLSFIQRPEDIAEAKKIARGRAAVMAKIEKPQAVARLEDILDVTDALMVARGDLGVEMPLEKVPGVQKQITRAARASGKPVVVATQMLESMISSPVPTRAEVSDVATAIFEGADAVMLSAESAAGQFPVEAVTTMNRIAEEVERDPTYRAIIHAQRTDPAPTRSRPPRDRSPRRSIFPPSCAGPRRARPPCASRVSARRRRSSRSPPTSRPAAASPACGACIASSPRTRRTRTIWSIAPAASPSAKALPRRASASSSSPGCRSARRARPTWCASPMWARTRRWSSEWRVVNSEWGSVDSLRAIRYSRLQLVDRLDDRLRCRVLRHVADAFQQNQLGVRNERRNDTRVQVHRDHGVAIAADDHGRRRDRAIARHLRGDEGLERRDILRIGRELRRPQHQPRRAAPRVFGRRPLRHEHAGDAAADHEQPQRQRQRMREQWSDHPRGGERVVPGDAAGPRMGHGREQHEAGDALREIERQRRGERAGPGVAENDRPLDAELAQCLRDQRGLTPRRGIAASAGTIAEAVAGPIDQNDAAPRRERVPEGEPLVLEIAARAMQQHDRRTGGRTRRRQIDDMQPAAGGGHEATRGWMDAFKPRDADCRDAGADGKDRDGDDERDEERHEHCRRGPRALR